MFRGIYIAWWSWYSINKHEDQSANVYRQTCTHAKGCCFFSKCSKCFSRCFTIPLDLLQLCRHVKRAVNISLVTSSFFALRAIYAISNACTSIGAGTALLGFRFGKPLCACVPFFSENADCWVTECSRHRSGQKT